MNDTELEDDLEDDLQAAGGWWLVGCIVLAEGLHIVAVISAWEWLRG